MSEREKFEAWFEKEYLNCKIGDLRDKEFWNLRIDFSWKAWQAAKVGAVPDGHIVVPKEPTKEINKKAEHFYIVECMNIFEAVVNATLESQEI